MAENTNSPELQQGNGAEAAKSKGPLQRVRAAVSEKWRQLDQRIAGRQLDNAIGRAMKAEEEATAEYRKKRQDTEGFYHDWSDVPPGEEHKYVLNKGRRPEDQLGRPNLEDRETKYEHMNQVREYEAQTGKVTRERQE